MKHLKTFEDKKLIYYREIKEHSVVELKDGRFGTIIHIYPDNENFEIEIMDMDAYKKANHAYYLVDIDIDDSLETSPSEVETITKDQIERILW